MLSIYNEGKYFTRTYWADKNAGEWDSSNLSADDLTYLEIQDGEGKGKAKLERMQELRNGCV